MKNNKTGDETGIFGYTLTLTAFRKRLPAILSLIFTVLWLCSLYSLCGLTGGEGVNPKERRVQVIGDREKDKLSLLKDKAAIYIRRREAAGSLVMPGSPDWGLLFASARGESLKFSLTKAPPPVKVKAIGVRGTSKVALLDVDGEEGRLMCEKDAFGAMGRVLRIDNEGVTWAWGSQQYRSLIWE